MTCSSTCRSHITDSGFYRGGYTTDEARQVFCDLRRLQRWLDVEVALVQCQAELGIVPDEAARELKKTARLELLDLESVQEDIARTNHSLIPLLNGWQEKTTPESGKFIHYGATTQDIQDTAQSLEIMDIFTIVQRDTAKIISQLSGLAKQYRDLVMIGRTHGQQALPTTFGAKIPSGWMRWSATGSVFRNAVEESGLPSCLAVWGPWPPWEIKAWSFSTCLRTG